MNDDHAHDSMFFSFVSFFVVECEETWLDANGVCWLLIEYGSIILVSIRTLQTSVQKSTLFYAMRWIQRENAWKCCRLKMTVKNDRLKTIFV